MNQSTKYQTEYNSLEFLIYYPYHKRTVETTFSDVEDVDNLFEEIASKIENPPKRFDIIRIDMFGLKENPDHWRPIKDFLERIIN